MPDYQLIEDDVDAFFEVPFAVYPKSSNYVSPFKPDLKRILGDTNPLWKEGRGERTIYTLRRDGELVGRITAHIHHASNKRHGWNRSYFGFFDCVDDVEVAGELLDAASAWGRERGCDEIWGNFNLTAMQQMGVVTDHHERAPYIEHIYTPPHIHRLLEAHGFTREFPMTTFEVDLSRWDPDDPDHLITPARLRELEEAGFEWRNLSRKTFDATMRHSARMLNAGFDANPFFVPLTEEEFMFSAKEMMLVIDWRISSIVYKDGEPAGVIICIPDLNTLLKATGSRVKLSTPYHFIKYRLDRKRASLIFASVDPKYHGEGLAPSMLFRMCNALVEAGYETMGATWVADVNTKSLRLVEKVGAAPLHRVHLYKRAL
jgi:GNAT superfamily N-acetyltransferase